MPQQGGGGSASHPVGGTGTGLRGTLPMAEIIVSDPKIMMGKPVIAGTRITVELVLEKLAAGQNIDDIVDAHPRLTREAVLAAVDYAKQTLRADVVYPVLQRAA